MMTLFVVGAVLTYIGLGALAIFLARRPALRPFGWMLGAVVLVPALWLVTRLFNTWALDRKLEELCAKDGGVWIYETVRLPKERFDSAGVPFNEFRHLFATGKYLGPEYQVERDYQVLVAGDPRLQRTETRVLRVQDGKLLAKWTQYARIGGGAPLPSPPPGRSCEADAKSTGFPYNVFVMEE